MSAMPTTTPQKTTKPDNAPSDVIFAASHTTPEQAVAAVTEFLFDHVGNQLVAGEPLPMVSAFQVLWIVPIYLSYVHTGIVGNVGVVAVEDETGRVVAWTPIAQIKRASRNLRESLEPQLSQQFHKQVSTDLHTVVAPVIS